MTEIDALFQLQRIEIVEIGDARQDRAGDQRAVATAHARAFEHNRILARQARGRRQPGHDAEATPAGQSLDLAIAVGEQCRIAAELVDDETPRIIAASARPITALVPTTAAITPPRSISPTSTTGTFGFPREPHIGDVAGPQVDLGRRARAFDARRCRTAPAQPADNFPHHLAEQRARAPRGNCPAPSVPRTLPAMRRSAATCDRPGASSSTGFMSLCGSTRQAIAWSAWARPISPPSAVTAALFGMFCGLNGQHPIARDWRRRGRARRPAPTCRHPTRFLEHQRAHATPPAISHRAAGKRGHRWPGRVARWRALASGTALRRSRACRASPRHRRRGPPALIPSAPAIAASGQPAFGEAWLPRIAPHDAAIRLPPQRQIEDRRRAVRGSRFSTIVGPCGSPAERRASVARGVRSCCRRVLIAL